MVVYALLCVQIVPLWNWNSREGGTPERASPVQIVPLWNWNHKNGPNRFCACRFKLYLYGIEIRLLHRRRLRVLVQIVPLWNWNIFSGMRMEQWSVVQIVPLWNWNIVEAAQNFKRAYRSNCTFMELKSGKVFYGSDMNRNVQIVPLWNWNEKKGIHLREITSFKLYLYGIEISKLMHLTLLGVVFKLYLYGIEMMLIIILPR